MINISIASRFKHAWSAFRNQNGTQISKQAADIGPGFYRRPDRPNISMRTERTIVNAIYNRIAVDVSQIKIYEALVDENDNALAKVSSGLTECLTVSANIDESGPSFIKDAVLSMFDEGVVALVPTSASRDPRYNDSYDIYEMRVAKVVQWYPQDVQVHVYNQNTGQYADLTLPKSCTYIIENPFYQVMNQPNGVAKRLIRKLSLLDMIDERTNSGKMDLIIQLPYVIKTEARQQQAERRREQIEQQLNESKYGIAYTDGTERIIQLNRPIENNLQSQIEYLTNQLYSQLGITQEILNGTANEQVMLNYYYHTIDPVVSAITEEITRKYLTKTARTRGHAIVYFRDPFKLVPVNNIAEIADKFTRNEILTSNEIRSIVGFAPSDQASANVLRNKNLNQTPEQIAMEQEQFGGEIPYEEELSPEEELPPEEEIQVEDEDVIEDYSNPELDKDLEKFLNQFK